jgi:hypothetical protein
MVARGQFLRLGHPGQAGTLGRTIPYLAMATPEELQEQLKANPQQAQNVFSRLAQMVLDAFKRQKEAGRK